MVRMTYPMVDDDLADDVLAAIGAARDHDVETVTTRFHGWLPAGSTAKWAAVDRGELPPGAEARAALEDRLAGSEESWSCWSFCTGLGGVLAALGHDVRIVVEHLRTGRDVPMVDYHSVLVVDGALVDSYLGPSAPIAAGEDVTRSDGWAAWIPGDRPDHLGSRAGGSVFRYRQLADHLDRRDVEAFCSISVTHTGVGRRRMAHLLRDGNLWFVREGDDGAAELRVSGGNGPFEQQRRTMATGRYEDLLARMLEPPVGVDAGAGG